MLSWLGYRQLWQLGVLRFASFRNGDVGVSVFPEGEEVLVGGSGW